MREGNSRSKDGIELAVSYYTTGIGMTFHRWCNTGWRSRPRSSRGGKRSESRFSSDKFLADDFFIVSPENEQSYAHFYRDVQMYTNGPISPLPEMYFADWYAGPDNSNVAQAGERVAVAPISSATSIPNSTSSTKNATTTTDPERAAELYIQMNDLIVDDFVVVPLVAMTGRVLRVRPPNSDRERRPQLLGATVLEHRKLANS